MYHSVRNPEAFAAQMNFLRRNFELIGLPELHARLAAGSLRGMEVAITFDDGIRNHFTAAYPVLRTLAVPATFFVCPGLIDTGHWIWNMELRARLRALPPAMVARLIQETGASAQRVEDLIEAAKRMAREPRDAFVQRIRDLTRGFVPTADQLELCAPMTWQQLRALDPALITVGSHTSSHPILATATTDEAIAEIAGSRRRLETRLDREVRCFCYPNGSFDERILRITAANYDYAVTTESGLVANGCRPHEMPRIPDGDYRGLFQWRLHRPGA
jgi:peptidoglycan/xylan/chitin deacetylase (PgdA/CDA1 family)